jgi:hypothetical protein
VGVQHAMLLILRKWNMKLLSVSKKKFFAYESLYTSPLSTTGPFYFISQTLMNLQRSKTMRQPDITTPIALVWQACLACACKKVLMRTQKNVTGMRIQNDS